MKKYVQLTLILAMLISIPLAIRNMQGDFSRNSKAATGPGVLRIEPTPITATKDANGMFNVYLLPNGASVSSVELVISYDPAVIQILGVTPGNFFTDPSAQIGSPVEIIKNIATPGRIHYAIGFPLGSNYSSTTAGAVAMVSYKALAVATDSPVTIETTGTPSSMVADINASNVLGSVNNSTVTITGPQGASLSLANVQPASPQVVNRTFTADVVLDTAGQPVSGVDARLAFDPAVMRVTQVVQNPTSAFSSYPSLTFDNVAGTIILSANIGSGPTPPPVNSASEVIGTITFQPTSVSASATVTFDYTSGALNDSNIVLYDPQSQQPADILSGVSNLTFVVQAQPTGVPTNTPTPTATPLPTSTPTTVPPNATPTSIATATPTPTAPNAQAVTLRYKLQGKTRAGVSNATAMVLKHRLANATLVTTLNLTGNDLGETIVSLVPGNYVFLIDVPGYLAKKVGTDSQPIAIISGNSLLDLSLTLILGGDFNDDGIINEVDYTLHFLTSYAKNVALVDLDGSGQVNNLDFAIMRNNWNKQDDAVL